MEIVIANAQKEFPDLDEIEPENNNKKNGMKQQQK